MSNNLADVERVIGFDSHPDSFTAAIVQGKTPAAAIVQKTCNKVPLHQIKTWATKHTTPKDLFLLEASGNSFQLVRTLASADRRALVLESGHLGKLKEAHANNDKISAIRIAKAYLAGTAKIVWVPDTKTQERRDWFHAHKKAVKANTQCRNQLLSYLSDNGVRLPKGTQLTPSTALTFLLGLRPWSPSQRQVLEVYLLALQHANQQRAHWRSLIAQEVIADPMLMSLVRLCGVRDLIAFSMGAMIGDIDRFANPRKLVKYVGLNPAFDDSGEGKWRGGIGGHGRKDLRCLLIEAAQAILRSKKHLLAKWGRKLEARKGSRNLAAAAVARKLTTAIWYLMKGRYTELEEIDTQLSLKIGKIITQVGPKGLKLLGKTRLELRALMEASLKTGRQYQIDPDKKLKPKTDKDGRHKPTTLKEEYGIC